MGGLSAFLAYVARYGSRVLLLLAVGIPESGAAEAAVESAGGGLLFLAQQLINATTVSAVYGLIALGYTLIFRIIGRINLAFGDLAMIGAVVTFISISVLASQGEYMTPVALSVALTLVLFVGVGYGHATYRLVFRPLRRTVTYAPIVATLGLGIVLQEFTRLSQGGHTRWLPPVYSDTSVLWERGGYSVTIVPGQLLVIGLVLLVYLFIAWLMARTGFGKRYRASAEDPGMAALCGIGVDRVVLQSVAINRAGDARWVYPYALLRGRGYRQQLFCGIQGAGCRSPGRYRIDTRRHAGGIVDRVVGDLLGGLFQF